MDDVPNDLRLQRASAKEQAVSTERAARDPQAASRRLTSVDALRGFTIFWIIGGDGLAWSLKDMSDGRDTLWASVAGFFSDQFMHVPWEGLSFYDLIFPMLVFVTGISIVFSLTRLVDTEGIGRAHLRVMRRATLLFVLGLIYYGGVNHEWPDIRLMGVLQR